jgi:hypothetical protein
VIGAGPLEALAPFSLCGDFVCDYGSGGRRCHDPGGADTGPSSDRCLAPQGPLLGTQQTDFAILATQQEPNRTTRRATQQAALLSRRSEVARVAAGLLRLDLSSH